MRLVLVDDPLDGVDDVEEADATVVEGLHGLLVGRVEDGRIRAAGRPTRLASSTAGNAALSSGSNFQVLAVRPVERHADPGTRFGQSRPSEIGRRMSGGEAWARVEPSTNSTIECTMDCGCTVTSIGS